MTQSGQLEPLSPRAVELVATLHRTKGVYQKLTGSTSSDLAILDELRALAEPRIVLHVLDVVFGWADPMARAAAEVVDAALRRTPLTALAELEDECREMSRYWQPGMSGWPSLRPVQLVRHHGAGETAPAIAGVASFHPSGYVREAAVQWLDALTGGRELPFLLLRLNDWVTPVAQRTLAAVQRRFVGSYADALVDCLPLFAALERTTRRDHSATNADVYAVLRDPAQGDALARGRRSDDRVVRRISFSLARESVPGAGLLREAMHDTDPALRFATVRDTASTLSGAELAAVLPKLTADAFAPVRRSALDAAATRLAASDASMWLEQGLLDTSRAVREVARFHLNRVGATIDATQFYRDAIHNERRPRTLAAALAGLRETGNAADARFALGLLDHERPIVRRAAVRAVAGLDAEHHLTQLLAVLSDPSRTVTRAVAEALLPHIGVIGLDGLRATIRTARRPGSRLDAISLSFGLGKWNSLLVLLESASDADDGVRRAVGKWLQDWSANQNRAYTQPAPAQLTAIERALAATGSMLEAKTRNEIEGVVAYWSRN